MPIFGICPIYLLRYMAFGAIWKNIENLKYHLYEESNGIGKRERKCSTVTATFCLQKESAVY
jgi:hypothetical protein